MVAYLLNLADLFLTLHALSHGGVELNPLLQSLPVMVAWKVVGVAALCAVMQNVKCKMQNERAGKFVAFGLNLCTVVYGALCVYHFYYIFGGA